MRDVAFESTSLGPDSPIGYIFASPLVPVQQPVTAYASQSFPKGARHPRRRGRSDAPHPHRIQIRPEGDRDLDAAQGSVRKTPRRLPGFRPCDDRGPARPRPAGGLCLGYLRTIPPPGKPRLQGADATHAWVSLWCGEELGWIGFDPTNDILVENDHIVLAVGRDFSDVSPVDGIIVGSRKQKLGVAVDVLLVE